MVRCDIEANAARTDEATTESTPAERGSQVEEVASQATAKRRRRQVANVIRKRTEAAHVVCQPLELECNRT
jgi:hypothetical protein